MSINIARYRNQREQNVNVQSRVAPNVYDNRYERPMFHARKAPVYAQNTMYKSSAPGPTGLAPGYRQMARTVNVEEGVYKKNVRIDDIKGKMKREADQKINLVSDKMELEFMIQDQKEAQESLKKEFERLTREKKLQIEKLDQVNQELDGELEKTKQRSEDAQNQV